MTRMPNLKFGGLVLLRGPSDHADSTYVPGTAALSNNCAGCRSKASSDECVVGMPAFFLFHATPFLRSTVLRSIKQRSVSEWLW